MKQHDKTLCCIVLKSVRNLKMKTAQQGGAKLKQRNIRLGTILSENEKVDKSKRTKVQYHHCKKEKVRVEERTEGGN